MIFPQYVQKKNNIRNPHPAFEFSEDFLINLKPNMSKIFVRKKENGGNIIRWRTNKDSFRGADLNNDEKYRVIVYGDSNIQARFSNHAKTFAGQLDYYLRKAGILDVEVINAGVVGFGPDQSLIRFSKEADKYKPNLVVFHIFADNDFGDIVRNRLFDLDARGKLIETPYRKTIDKLLTKHKNAQSYISRLLIVRAANRIIKKLSGEKENYVNKLQKKTRAAYLIYKESKPRQSSHFGDYYDIDIAIHPEQESSRIKIQLMSEVLKKANNLANLKNINFLVVIQPSVIDLTIDNFVLNYKYLQRYQNYKRNNLTRKIERICISHNIPYVNLFNLFLDNNPADLYFRAGNNHWNDQGQKIAAKSTAYYIIQYSMIKRDD